jgi:zinc protease
MHCNRLLRGVRGWRAIGAAAALVSGALTPVASAQISARSIPSLESQSFTLANGLRVVLREDHKAPIVNVYLAYQVGSAAERAGKTGLAHVFEHLMFRGSEHSPADYATELARLGATDVIGVTHQDYTRYWQTVPTASLATALWMEAERMCCLLPALTQSRLDEQRNVVRNEILEGLNQPFGRTNELLLSATYPADHPYSRPGVGDVRDLDSITLADLTAFFRVYYTPNNAVLVLAGDFIADSARAMIGRYFGVIPAGPPVTTGAEWTEPPPSPRRTRVVDHVPSTRLTLAWTVPGLGTSDFDYLQMVANMLGGADSPLARRLVGRDLPATAVRASIDARITSSSFVIHVDARSEVDFARIEALVVDELRALERDGPTARGLKLAKADLISGFTRRLDRIGGFGGQSDEIGTNVVFALSAAGHLNRAARMEYATTDTIRAVAARWLSHPTAIIEWVRTPRRATEAESVRPARPGDAPPAIPAFGDIQRTRMANGLTVLLARRPGNRMISIQLLMPSGSNVDPSDRAGLAAVTMAGLMYGTSTRSAEQFMDDVRGIGASIQGRADTDYSVVSVSAPLTAWSTAAHLAASTVIAPAFPQAVLDRLQREQAARGVQTAGGPAGPWQRLIFSALIRGDAAQPPRSPMAAAPITREDVVAFHTRWIRPDSATLIVAGDIELADLMVVLDTAFRNWRPGRGTPPQHSARAALSEPVVYLIDRPGALTTEITVATPLPPHSAEHDGAVDAFVSVFGSGAISRLSGSLRTDKGWAYSPTALVLETRARRLLVVRAPVRSDVAIDAVREIRQLVHELASVRPMTEGELNQTVGELTMSLSNRWEAVDAVASSVAQIVRVGMPVADYWKSYPSHIAALTRDEVTAVARSLDASPQWVWVIVGDRSQLEAPLRAAKIGRVVTP